MGFEIFGRKVQYKGTPAVSFTTLGRLSFNKAAVAQLKKSSADNVLLLWDKELRLIGVHPVTQVDNRAYRLHWNKNDNGCVFSATTFLKHIGFNISGSSKTLPAKWDEKEQMFLVEVPIEYLK